MPCFCATGLDGNAREFVPARHAADANDHAAFVDGLPRTLRVRRPCRFATCPLRYTIWRA